MKVPDEKNPRRIGQLNWKLDAGSNEKRATVNSGRDDRSRSAPSILE
jgi:hypothetical protein